MSDVRPDPRSSDLRLERLLCRELIQLDRRRFAEQQYTTIRIADLRLLWLLSDEQPRTLREIAVELGLEQSTVNRQVNAAIRAGHVRRYAVPGRSAQSIAQTDAGRTAFDREVAVRLGLYRQALDELGPERAEAFVAALAAFNNAYGTAIDEENERAGAAFAPLGLARR